jgi:hypothetical protein
VVVLIARPHARQLLEMLSSDRQGIIDMQQTPHLDAHERYLGRRSSFTDGQCKYYDIKPTALQFLRSYILHIVQQPLLHKVNAFHVVSDDKYS